jgi:hypothetical protein
MFVNGDKRWIRQRANFSLNIRLNPRAVCKSSVYGKEKRYVNESEFALAGPERLTTTAPTGGLSAKTPPIASTSDIDVKKQTRPCQPATSASNHQTA